MSARTVNNVQHRMEHGLLAGVTGSSCPSVKRVVCAQTGTHHQRSDGRKEVDYPRKCVT